LNLNEEKVNEVLEDFTERSNLPVIKHTTENTYLDWHIYNFIIKNKKDKIIRARQIDVLLYIFHQFNYYGYTATTDKFTFSFRSPASGLLCHPLAWIEAKFDIKAPGLISLATQSSAGICAATHRAAGAAGHATRVSTEIRAEDRTVRKVPLVSFADGDGGFGGAISDP